MKHVTIYCDGACRGNPGPGGWAATLHWNGYHKEIGGPIPGPTTNQRAELTAAIGGLEALKEPCKVEMYSDSEYVTAGMTTRVPRWVQNNWTTSNHGTVKNRDLWERLLEIAAKHTITWIHVPGHTGHPQQERANELAQHWAELACQEGVS